MRKRATEMTPAEMYAATCKMTDELVGRFKGTQPEFVFGPPDVAMIVSIARLGARLARNSAALDLVAALLEEADRRKLDYPTVMMLRATLDLHGVPIKFVPLADLGMAPAGS